MEQIGKFFQSSDFYAMRPWMSDLNIVSGTLNNLVSRLNFVLPGRLPQICLMEIASPVPSINYGLVSHYSGNWSAPRRSWFGRNLSRIDVMRYGAKSDKEVPSKAASNNNKQGNTSDNTPRSQVTIKSDELKISDAKFKEGSHNSSLVEIIEMGAKLEKSKAKDHQEKIQKLKDAVNASSSDLKPKEVSAKASGTMAKVEEIKIDVEAKITDAKLKKEESVAEEKLGAMQAKLGVVEAKLSEPPQARFSGADYALKPKELLREISRRRYKLKKKIVIDNANEPGFFKRINSIRLEKWKRFPKARMDNTKCKPSTKDTETKK